MPHIPRNHYLVVHDAIRKLLGPDAQLAAFVKAQHAFQCDMLVNDARTDPEELMRAGARHSGGGIGDDAAAKAGVGEFARRLQGVLGICDVVPHTRRVDVIFRDRSLIQLALGAAKRDLPYALETGADVNQEPDWRLRNRLRISLGYDEELFLAQCTRSMNVAARILEKRAFDSARYSALMSTNAAMAAMYEASGQRWQAVLPPVTYWQAHCYSLMKAYPCRHYQQIVATVEHNYAAYYDEFPMTNPYCDGEDLNTIQVVKWLCEAFNAGAAVSQVTSAASSPATSNEWQTVDCSMPAAMEDGDAEKGAAVMDNMTDGRSSQEGRH
ncbi:hypothetical protein conserved [Leishmania donovani]|uniref:Hypothetical_protein_conserved n=1 Tax=Leishmania donovani TaxID=5661 RepID=A0A504XUQ3_LEIDO|nr:hypothetical protein CGC20_20110 [Leishmania donovani]CAJ1986147.1 hypothetical protein conserved [Leishmania donovani]VDZ42047.1 hypothetical_protein_conserved [Leishmania donovani]